MNLKQDDVNFAMKINKNEKITKDLTINLSSLHFYLKNLLERVNNREQDSDEQLSTTKAILKNILNRIDNARNESLKYVDFYKH